jgi:type 1 glutamine amidotransferase
MTYFKRRTFWLLVLLMPAWVMAAPAEASVPDCPLAHQRYSLDTPLIDLLLDPRSHAVIEQREPWLARQPGFFTRTKAPAFSAIITLPILAIAAGRTIEDSAALDAELRAIRITPEAERERCARYDENAPAIDPPVGRPAILVFEKVNGFRDIPSINAAHKALQEMGERNHWSMIFTDNGAVFDARLLRRYDAVVWNNVSGDVLTVPQRRAFRRYIERGGGFAGIHGSGGDPVWWWDWYADTLIGARFVGHPDSPQFQEGRVVVDDPADSLMRGIDPDWRMSVEWYAFAASPRLSGAHILARLDEGSYRPMSHGRSIAMGQDHPLAWTRCVGHGRAFYTAIGHRPESYQEPHSLALLERGIGWAAGNSCAAQGETQR